MSRAFPPTIDITRAPELACARSSAPRLSYTNYTYSDLRVAALPPSTGAGLCALRDADNTPVLNVSVTVTNDGEVAGTEVVQVYVQDPAGLPFVPYWKRLVGFARVALRPGESRTVQVGVEWQDLAMHDKQMVLRLWPGTYLLSAGGASDSTPVATNVTVPP